MAAAAFACGLAGTAIAGTIVIRAEGPSKGAYPPGKTLGARVTLARGDKVVVFDSRGTRTLSGPGTFDLNAQGAAAPSALTALLTNSGARQTRTGATRGNDTGPRRNPNLWYVDTSRSGTFCLPALTSTYLWRSEATTPVTWSLARSSDGKTVPLTFAATQNFRSWPVKDLGLAEATDYRLSGPGLSAPVNVRFAAIGPVPASAEDLAAALLAKGCRSQLDQLVDAGKAAEPTG